MKENQKKLYSINTFSYRVFIQSVFTKKQNPKANGFSFQKNDLNKKISVELSQIYAKASKLLQI